MSTFLLNHVRVPVTTELVFTHPYIGNDNDDCIDDNEHRYFL